MSSLTRFFIISFPQRISFISFHFYQYRLIYAFWMVLLLSQLSIALKIKSAHYFTWIRSPETITPAVNVYCRQLKWLTHYSEWVLAHGSRTTAVPTHNFHPTGCAWRGLWQNHILPCCHIQWLTEVLKICALVPQQESLVLEHVEYKYQHSVQGFGKTQAMRIAVLTSRFSTAAPSVL